MRTTGRVTLGGMTLYSVQQNSEPIANVCDYPGEENTENTTEGYANAAHLAACWNAIEAVGGDPATVGELVAALEILTDRTEMVLRGVAESVELFGLCAEARALLARVGKGGA